MDFRSSLINNPITPLSFISFFLSFFLSFSLSFSLSLFISLFLHLFVSKISPALFVGICITSSWSFAFTTLPYQFGSPWFRLLLLLPGLHWVLWLFGSLPCFESCDMATKQNKEFRNMHAPTYWALSRFTTQKPLLLNPVECVDKFRIALFQLGLKQETSLLVESNI